VELAKASVPTELRPDPAPNGDVENLRKAMRLPTANSDGRDGRDGRGHDWTPGDGPRGDRDGRNWDHRVRQWDRDWVHYDRYYRPVICNPYRYPVKIVYVYLGAPRIIVIRPWASILIDAPIYAAYSFTAFVLDGIETAIDVAVGTFFGGGYYPGPGLAPPPPPPPLLSYDNVPVFVNYSQARYEPFVVRRIVDLGVDPVYGGNKALLDGVTPVWGSWTQGENGQRQFVVTKTQQYPGLDFPEEGPLPAGYQLRLANDNSSPGFNNRDIFVLASSAVVVTLGLAWAGFEIGRRRRPRPLP
jgi:hypothetical protein